jgi:hypothetical protein
MEYQYRGEEQLRDCGTRNYDNINRAKVESILNELIAHGSMITGNNPWDIDTQKHGVMLRGAWNEATLTLSITVTDADWYVPRKAIWENIDSLMRHIQDAG